MSPVLAPKKKDAQKQELDGDASHSKQIPSASGKAMPSAKSKRKHSSEDTNKNAHPKKLKKVIVYMVYTFN